MVQALWYDNDRIIAAHQLAKIVVYIMTLANLNNRSVNLCTREVK